MEYYTGKGRNGQDKKKKTCRETQHVKIDMERDASIIICRMVAVGENYNSTRDSILIPTYGTSEYIIKKIDQLGYRILDNTCPRVKFVQRIVSDASKKGWILY